MILIISWILAPSSTRILTCAMTLQVLKQIFNPHLDGNKVPVKITEYGPEMLKNIRWQSGFSDDYLIKYNLLSLIGFRAFAPIEN